MKISHEFANRKFRFVNSRIKKYVKEKLVINCMKKNIKMNAQCAENSVIAPQKH